MTIDSEIYGLSIGDSSPVRIMGVINLSAESFYKASYSPDDDMTITIAKAMVENGATIIDIGARSTAPGVDSISISEEEERIAGPIEILCQEVPSKILFSVDTQYAEIAHKCYDICQNYSRNIIVNDVSCLQTDPALADFVIETQVPVLLMASKNVPGDCLAIGETVEALTTKINDLVDKGYPRHLILVDPGIGHWTPEKLPIYDLALINQLQELRILNLPILVAISRKSFIGAVLNLSNPGDRFVGTLAATAIAVFNGAHVIRTHDVNPETWQTVALAESIRNLKF